MKKTITRKIKILAVLIALVCTAAQTMYAQDTRTSCKWNDAYETVECDTKAIKPSPDINPLAESIQSLDSGSFRRLLPKEDSYYSRSQQIQQEIEQVQRQQAQLLQQALHPQPQQQNPATNTTQSPPSLPQNEGYAGYYVWQNPVTKNKMLLSSAWEGGAVAQPFDCPLVETFDCVSFSIVFSIRNSNQGPMFITAKAVKTNNLAMDAEEFSGKYNKNINLKNPKYKQPIYGQSKFINGVKVYEEQFSNGRVTTTLKYGNLIWRTECLYLGEITHYEICNRLAVDILKTALPQSQ